MSMPSESEPTSFRPRRTGSPLQEERRRQRAVEQTTRRLIREHKKSRAENERRQQGRVDFVQPVRVRLENLRELTLLSRDISTTGIRLIGTTSLLGQKITLDVPVPGSPEKVTFVVRVLWTCSVAEGLFENGGKLLEKLETA